MWGSDNLMPGVTLADLDYAAGVDEQDTEAGWWFDEEWGMWRLLDDDEDESDVCDDGGPGDAA